MTLQKFLTIIEMFLKRRFGNDARERQVIRKLTIIGISAAIAHGCYRWMESSNFLGTLSE